VLGIPGIPYTGFTQHYFWREATREVEQIAEDVQHKTGQKPLVVGMSRWSIASSLSFYNRSGEPMEVRSRNLFGDEAAMHSFWYPSESPTSRPIILVGMIPKELERNRQGQEISPMLVQPSPIQERIILQEGKPLRKIYYRVAHGYLGIEVKKTEPGGSVR